MANDFTASGGTDNTRTRFIKGDLNEGEFSYKRERAQTMNFAKNVDYVQRNPAKNYNLTFIQYTRERINQYIQNPSANQNTLRDISRFIWRHSQLYRTIIQYLATIPLFSYNLCQDSDFGETINASEAWSKYYKVLSEFNKFDIKKEGCMANIFALRDGFFVGFMYEEEKRFFMPLDVGYVRIVGKNAHGQWVVYFDASYFDKGNNSEFVLGVDGNSDLATWDKVFIDGYKGFKSDRNKQFFRLPPERTCVLLSCPDDEFPYPLPYYLPIFSTLLNLLDLESILQNRTELENYKLIVSQIPLISSTENIDDYAISMEYAKYFNNMIKEEVPDLIGSVISPMKIDTISFDRSNTTGDVDTLGKAIRNMFNNSGASEVVVAGGGENPSTLAIKYSQIADTNNIWILVDRFESWLKYYISENISPGYEFRILKITEYNRKEMVDEKRENITVGGSVLDFFAATDGSPFGQLNKLRFEFALGIRDLMIPVGSSYNGGASNGEKGRPQSDDDELSSSADRTRNREGLKN